MPPQIKFAGQKLTQEDLEVNLIFMSDTLKAQENSDQVVADPFKAGRKFTPILSNVDPDVKKSTMVLFVHTLGLEGFGGTTHNAHDVVAEKYIKEKHSPNTRVVAKNAAISQAYIRRHWISIKKHFERRNGEIGDYADDDYQSLRESVLACMGLASAAKDRAEVIKQQLIGQAMNWKMLRTGGQGDVSLGMPLDCLRQNQAYIRLP